MDDILGYFDDWRYPATMAVQTRVTTYDSSTGKTTGQSNWVTVTGLSAVPIFFYREQMAVQFVDDRLKKIVKGLILIRPSDLNGITVTDKMRGLIDGKPFYFIAVDNILGFGKVVQIPVAEVDVNG